MNSIYAINTSKDCLDIKFNTKTLKYYTKLGTSSINYEYRVIILKTLAWALDEADVYCQNAYIAITVVVLSGGQW